MAQGMCGHGPGHGPGVWEMFWFPGGLLVVSWWSPGGLVGGLEVAIRATTYGELMCA